jgi:tetratricopeptide (TPR) repeat protein
MIVNELNELQKLQEPQEPQEVQQNPDPHIHPQTAWLESLRLFQLRKAEAQYRALELMGQHDPQISHDLKQVLAWQEATEAKRYLEALKCLAQITEPSNHISEVVMVLDVMALERATVSLKNGEDAAITEPHILRTHLEMALQHPLTKAEAHNRLGVLHALLGEPDLARAEFDAALLERPEHYRALTNLGNLLLEAGDAVAAEERYRQAVKIAPDYGIAHNNLAVALKKQRKISAAVQALKQSTRLERRKFQEESRRNSPSFGAVGKLLGPILGPLFSSLFRSRVVQYVVIGGVLYGAYRLFLHS